jgi:hypothetical protein
LADQAKTSLFLFKNCMSSFSSSGLRWAPIMTCETWVPLGPHRPGSRPSPTSGSGLPKDPPTC